MGGLKKAENMDFELPLAMGEGCPSILRAQ